MTRHGHKPIETFIEFREVQMDDGRATQVWDVVSTMRGGSDPCGYISWHAPWRKYVFHSPDDSFYDWEFLRYVADFTERQTAKRRVKP